MLKTGFWATAAASWCVPFLVYAIGFGGTHSYLFLSFSDFHLKSLADAGNSSQVVVNPAGLGLAQAEIVLGWWDSTSVKPFDLSHFGAHSEMYLGHMVGRG